MKINNSFSIYTCPNNRNHPLKRNTLSFRAFDFLDLPEKDIIEKIKASVTPDNFLGQGTEAEVYRIKDTNYCVRIPYLAQDIQRFKYSKELTPIDKVNHVVAKLGFGASVMKCFEGIVPKWYVNNSRNRFNLQKKIAEMPVKTYSELLHQIADAVDNEMFFDFSGGNLIVNTKKQKLTAIDFYGITDNPRPIRPLSEMYYVLTSYGSEEKTGKKIFDKIVDAGLEEFKPNKIPCMDIELFDFIDLVSKRNSDKNSHKHGDITENINKFLDFKSLVAERLHELRRLKKQEITDKSVSKELEEAVKSFAQLIKKVH